MKTQETPTVHDTIPRLLSAKQLGHQLGVDVRTIRRYDAAGKLPRPIRFGGSVRWRQEEIDLWLDAGCPNRKTWESLNQK